MIKRLGVAVLIVLGISGWIWLLVRGPWVLDGGHLTKITPGAGAVVNGFRTAVAAIGVGAAAIVGIYFTHRAYELNRSAQFSDRYAKAVELLGGESEALQMGGIYALERIMKDSPYDKAAVIETLAAFIRKTSPIPEEGPVELFVSGESNTLPSPVPASARAALEVIARRTPSKRDPAIRLERCDLRGLWIENANFDRARFEYCNLSGSGFPSGSVRGAYFMRANLKGLRLEGSDLTGSKFPEAQMEGCSLNGAKIDHVNMMVAKGLSRHVVDAAHSARGAKFPWT